MNISFNTIISVTALNEFVLIDHSKKVLDKHKFFIRDLPIKLEVIIDNKYISKYTPIKINE